MSDYLMSDHVAIEAIDETLDAFKRHRYPNTNERDTTP